MSTILQPTSESCDPRVVKNQVPKDSIGRTLLVALVAATIVALALLAFSWPTVTATTHGLPMAAVGSSKQIDHIMQNAPNGIAHLEMADSRAEAEQMIHRREVYGAFVLTGDDPEVLVSSASSPAIAQQLRNVAAQLQESIDDQGITGLQNGVAQLRRNLESGKNPNGTAGATGKGGTSDAAAAIPHVIITDVAPLSDNDPTGAGLAIAGLPLSIGGIISGAITSMLVRSRRMRSAALVAYGVFGGLGVALILQSWFGVLQGHFWLNAAAAGLAVTATAAIVSGLVSLVGPSGIAIGAVITMFIGNPIASLNQPKELLPGAWGEIGQFFVPGAAGTLLRDLSYFPGAAMATSWWVLIGWLLLGLALILVGHIRSRARLTCPPE